MNEKIIEKLIFYFWILKYYAHICDMKNNRPGGFPDIKKLERCILKN